MLAILFDSGAERKSVSYSFKHLLKHSPQLVTETFTVEMANGKKENTNDIIRLYPYPKRSILSHRPNVSFHKNFDVIIGMDWLSPKDSDVLCY